MPCPDASLRVVWEAFDRARGKVVTVPRKELEHVIACHRERSHEDAALVAHKPRANSKTIDCHRAPLFEMLRSHTCG